jgi:hypothetical protein
MAPADLPGPRQQDVIEDKLKKRVEYARKVINDDLDDYCLFDDYHAGHQQHPYTPAWADPEVSEINARSVTNMMQLAVRIPSQMTFMDSCVRGKNSAPQEWKVGYYDSGFHSKQKTLATAALKYGVCYVGVENLGLGKPRPKIYSTKNTTAIFTDPVNDTYPLYLVTILSQPRDKDNPGAAIYMDKEQVIHYTITEKDWVVDGKPIAHGLGVTPAVRFYADIDDEGRTFGIVESLIEFQDAINQAKRNLLMNNTYGAQKVRFASGVAGELERDANGQPIKDGHGNFVHKPVELSSARLLSSPNDSARLSSVDETPADGFIATMEELVREFAVAAQIPPHSLLGNLSNLSAETLVAALGQTLRFVFTLQTTWGESHRALLRLMALDLGEITIDEEYDVEPQWRDMSDRSFGAIVDGLGKMATMLGIPRKALWRWVPGVTGGEIELWEDGFEEEQQMLMDQQFQVNTPQNGALRERRPRPGRSVNESPGAAGSGGGAPSSAS